MRICAAVPICANGSEIAYRKYPLTNWRERIVVLMSINRIPPTNQPRESSEDAAWTSSPIAISIARKRSTQVIGGSAVKMEISYPGAGEFTQIIPIEAVNDRKAAIERSF